MIQESLLRDSFLNSLVLEPEENIFEQDEIRSHVSGLVKQKAPALLRMFRVVLGDANDDFIQSTARILLTER